jgi:hypothetical protein
VQSLWLYGIWHERMGHCVLSSVCDRQTCCRDAVAAFGGEGASRATAKPFKAEAVTCQAAPELGTLEVTFGAGTVTCVCHSPLLSEPLRTPHGRIAANMVCSVHLTRGQAPLSEATQREAA